MAPSFVVEVEAPRVLEVMLPVVVLVEFVCVLEVVSLAVCPPADALVESVVAQQSRVPSQIFRSSIGGSMAVCRTAR